MLQRANLSSFENTLWPQDTNPPRAQLFEKAGFSGKKTEVQDDIPNLMTRHSLNRAASIRVLGGA